MSPSKHRWAAPQRPLFTSVSLGMLLMGMHSSYATLPEDSPKARKESIIVSGDARFTVLTPTMIRMEWSENSRFEDGPSLVFLNRRLDTPKLTSKTSGETLTIETDSLHLEYVVGSGKFNSQNLRIRSKGMRPPFTWSPGTKDTGNLGGTIRTLDGVRGRTKLEPGILSKDGWVLIDDSERPLFDDSEWKWVVPRKDVPHQDWYFLGYGRNYRRALFDFTRVAGTIPLPPRFVFGAWWSRYWAYTDTELMRLVEEYERNNVPLDVLVVDMDWHLTFPGGEKDQAGQSKGWTGYTWNRDYFPDPEAFLSWVKNKNLKVTLNLHPASGIQPHEEQYPAMAKAMGIDPATKKYVPFAITNKQFARHYFEIVLKPMERIGIDFWWLDWQQWNTTDIKGVTPTWWLNYVHFSEMERQSRKRPLIFHRYGGLGNHRYQIGFSGDAISVWESLEFQPYFTATASNVLFGYWSHDIGGHQPGKISPELYTRWIQWGIVSPALRTHTTKNPDAERRIWAYPPEYFAVMREAFQFRYDLIPYIYTASRDAYDTGVSLCRPMYYDYPNKDEAYRYEGQYFFGGEVISAPVTSPLDSVTKLSKKEVWLPEGTWHEWGKGILHAGGRTVVESYSLGEIPLFVKAGAIVPMQRNVRNTAEMPAEEIIWKVFPAKAGRGCLYEDDGISDEYKAGKYARFTVAHSSVGKRSVRIVVNPVHGSYKGMPKSRRHTFLVEGRFPPRNVFLNGKRMFFSADPKADSWSYDGNHARIVVTTGKVDVRDAVRIEIELSPSIDESMLCGIPGVLSRLKQCAEILSSREREEYPLPLFVRLLQTGRRVTLSPHTAQTEYENLLKGLPHWERILADKAQRNPELKPALALITSIRREVESAL